MLATCGKWLKPMGTFIAEADCPVLKPTNNTVQNGIQHVLKKALITMQNHPSGVIKVVLPSAFAEKFVNQNINDSPIPESATSSVTKRCDGIYEIEDVKDVIMLEDVEMGLKRMDESNMDNIKYFSSCRARGSLTNVLADNESISDNWNFNKIDDLLPQTSMTIFESSGALRTFSPEICNLPTCNLNISLDGQKVWYTISETDKFVLIEYLKSKKLATCNSPLNHGKFVVSLELLQKIGITVYKTIQSFGDLIIVKPGTVFQTIALHNIVSENVSFYAMGFEECAIRNKICMCVDRVKMTDDEAYLPSVLIGSILYNAQKALYGLPGEHYEVPATELNDDEQFVKERTQFATVEMLDQPTRVINETTPNRPIPSTGQTQISIHSKAKVGDPHDVTAVKKKGGAKRRVGSAAINVPVKRARIVNGGKIQNEPVKTPCEEGCGCCACIIKQFMEDNSVNNVNTDNAVEKSEAALTDVNRDHFDTVPNMENDKNLGVNEDYGGVANAKRLVLLTHPQMVSLKLKKRMDHFERYLKPCPIEKKREYEANRNYPKTHTPTRGLLTWLTNHISLDNRELKNLEEKRKAFNEEFDEAEMEAIMKRKNALIEMRQAYRILKQLFCLEPEALQNLISSGYSVLGIFRDFVNGSSEIHRANYLLAVDNAFKTLEKESKNDWMLLGSCKKLWWKKFGIDNRYYIPWQKWSVDSQSISIPDNFAKFSQQDEEFIVNPCLCNSCAHDVQCDCTNCELKKVCNSVDIFAQSVVSHNVSIEKLSQQLDDEVHVSQEPSASVKSNVSQEASTSVEHVISKEASTSVEHDVSERPSTIGEPDISQQSTYAMTDEPSQPPFYLNFCYDESNLPLDAKRKIWQIRRIQGAAMFRFTNKNVKPSEEIFGKTGQINLDQLKDGSYIGENLVDNYTDLIEKDTFDAEVAIILKSVFSEKGQLSNKQLLEISNMLNYSKWVLMPLLDENHWRLFVLDINKKEHFVYDPLHLNHIPDSVNVKIETVMSKLSCCFLQLKVYTQFSSQPVDPPELPLQKNMYDCGVFVLQVLRQLHAGVKNVQVHVPFARELMLAELIQDKLIDMY